MFKRAINWLDRLTQEFPPPKPQQPSIKLIQPTLTPAEQEIIKQAEQALQQSEIQSQAVIQSIQANPVICPAPEPVALLEIPEVLEVSPAPVAIAVEEISEVLEIPEVLENPIIAVEPSEAETKILEILDTIASLTTEGEPTPAEDTSAPSAEQLPAVSPAKATRKSLVEGHLDEAWADGFRTYEQLMNYVELATGKSCSKRVISAWKKARQLDGATDGAVAA